MQRRRRMRRGERIAAVYPQGAVQQVSGYIRPYCISGHKAVGKLIEGGRQGRDLEFATARRSRSFPTRSRSIRRLHDEAEAPDEASLQPAPPLADLPLYDLRASSRHAAVAGRHGAALARARAAPGPGAPARCPKTATQSPGGARSRKRRSTSTKLNRAHSGRVRRDRGPAILPPLGDRSARNRPRDGHGPSRRRLSVRAEARSPSSSPRPTSCRATARSSARRRK